jgi:hypothetical protein
MSDSLINSALTLSQCPICKGWIYECHVYGFRTRVEPISLNFQSEVKMRIEGRAIFQTIGVAELTLVPRTLWHIEQSDPKAKVFASHSCQTPEIFEPAPLFEPFQKSSREGIPF